MHGLSDVMNPTSSTVQKIAISIFARTGTWTFRTDAIIVCSCFVASSRTSACLSLASEDEPADIRAAAARCSGVARVILASKSSAILRTLPHCFA